uniref:Uncharacterized protein n=1 Tax=Amphimedon queenslandica TaxID=400682 RepID=A0A1X7SZV8_AMPQE
MIAWIALFAVMGVLLVVLLIALNLTVSVGTLNSLLFYANIVKLYEPFFSRKGALPVLSQVISWINLDFGFEICFYNGMDSYAKQWLQFAFPLYLWIIIIIIIQLCRRYGKISRLMGSHVVPVLSTLTFLLYTKLVRTIVIVLHKYNNFSDTPSSRGTIATIAAVLTIISGVIFLLFDILCLWLYCQKKKERC